MRSTHIILTLIMTVVLSIFVVVGYSLMVMPDEKLGKAYDAQRVDNFSDIADNIDVYYEKKKELPKNLQELLNENKKTSSSSSYDLGPAVGALNSLFSGMTIRDPQTNRPYSFKFSSSKDKEYNLCTSFFAKSSTKDTEVTQADASEDTPYYTDPYTYSKKTEHKIEYDKGYNCVKLSVISPDKSGSYDYYNDYGDGLSSPSTEAYSSSARDSQRKSDVRNIRTALESYFVDNSNYPTTLTALTSGSTPYIKTLPTDPKTKAQYTYTPSGSPPSSYKLTAKLENSSGGSTTYEVTSLQ